MYQLKVIKEEKTSNPDGGKHIVRILQGYGYDVRLVFDTGEEFTEKHVSILPTKCKMNFILYLNRFTTRSLTINISKVILQLICLKQIWIR